MTSSFRMRLTRATLVIGLLGVSACGASGTASTSAPTSFGEEATGEAPLEATALVIYNAQHENLTQAWADEFSKANGVKVQIRNGSDLEMANQLVAEGSASPADVFITENSPGMNIVEQAGLFQNVDADQGEQRAHQTAFLRQWRPRCLRQCVRRRCARLQQEAGDGAEVPQVLDQQGRSGNRRRQRVRISPAGHQDGNEQGAGSAGFPRGADCRSGETEQQHRGRPDDRGRAALNTTQKLHRVPLRPVVRLFRGAPPVFVVIAGAVAIISLMPLGFIGQSLIEAGPGRAKALILRPRVGELLLNTGLLTLGTMALCAVLGTAAAFLVERTTIPGARIWAPLLVAPLAVPAFVTSYGWVSVMPGIDGLGGATLIMSLAYYPLVFLPVAGALRGSDPAWEEQSRSLGLGPIRTFRRVTLPQLRPALSGGSLLVGLHTLAEFGAFQNLRFSTFTTAIYEQYQSTFASTAGNMLAVVLVLCCLALVGGEFLLGRRRVARSGSGSPRPHRRVRLGGRNVRALAFLAALVASALGVPVSSVAYWLRLGGVAVWNSEVRDAASTTVWLAAAAALVTTVLAFPTAFLAVRHRGIVSAVTERVSYVAGAIPSLVVGLALVTITVHYVKPIYQTQVTLLVAYLVLLLPRALVSIRAGLAQSRVELEEASRALGTSRSGTLRRVTLPLASPGIAVAGTLVFLAAGTELTATLMLGPTGLHTLATRFWSLSGSIDYVAAAPYAAVMIVLSIPVTFLLLQQSRRAVGR